MKLIYFPSPSSISTLPKEAVISTSQFTEELYQEPERTQTSIEIPQVVSDITLAPIPLPSFKECDKRDEHQFVHPVGDVPRPKSELSSPKDSDNTTHTFYVDIYNKDVENVVKAERIPTPEETTELPLVPGATINQKKEAEFSSPVGIVPTPADILQEPIEGKDDSQTFGADLYVKGNLEETSKIDQQLENVPIGLPSYKERISEDISDFPEPGEMGGKDKLKKKDIPAPDTLSSTAQPSLTSMDIKTPKDAAVAVVDIPKDPYNTEDLTVKSVETVEYLPEEATQAFPIPTPGVLEPDTPTDAKASSLFTDVVYELQTSSSNTSEKIISEEHVVLPPIPC